MNKSSHSSTMGGSKVGVIASSSESEKIINCLNPHTAHLYMMYKR